MSHRVYVCYTSLYIETNYKIKRDIEEKEETQSLGGSVYDLRLHVKVFFSYIFH